MERYFRRTGLVAAVSFGAVMVVMSLSMRGARLTA